MILAVIVTYYPKEDLLTDNINAIYPFVGKILIWQNSHTPPENFKGKGNKEKILYCGSGNNVGIPKALNFAWRYALENGYDYVLTMDQDSVWSDFGGFLKRTILNNNDGQSIWGPSVSHNKGKGFEPRTYINTSGMLVSTHILNEIGGWPETFKIDCVDMDFCYNARQQGIAIYRVKDTFLKHQLGERQRIRSLKNWKFKYITVHSAQRTYGIIRNGIIMGKKYKSFPLKKYLSDNILHRLSAILLYEHHRIRKLFAICKGIADGIACNSYRDKG